MMTRSKADILDDLGDALALAARWWQHSPEYATQHERINELLTELEACG